MTDEELTRLTQRIDELIVAPLAVVTRAIADLERLRDELQTELDVHRAGQASVELGRRADDARGSGRQQIGATTGEASGPPVTPERRRSLVAFGEPIGINRQSFQG